MSEPIVPHSEEQDRAIFSERRILLLGCGTQFGKTTVGAIRMKRKICEFTSKDDAFIIASPTYKTMMQSTLPQFKKLMEGCGEYNSKDDVFRIYGGGTVYCRTETDPDSIVGITNVRHIWGDEAGKFRLYFWENMQARADFYGCGIDLTTSPYALNWIHKELIKPVKAGKRKDVELVQASSWVNPMHSLHDPVKRAEKMATMDLRRFNMLYGGQWDKMEGLVYDCWDDVKNLVEPFTLPTGTKYYAGVDWGYTHPFVIKVRAITPEGMRYGISEFYKSGLTPSQAVEIAKQKQQIFNIECFYCDPARPDMIEEFNRNGIPSLPADNSIHKGIGVHYELIKSGRYKEFRGACPHSQDERETYHYPDQKDLGPDQRDKESEPVDQNNHAMDVDRYISIMTRTVEDKKAPKTPGLQQNKPRIEVLKRSHIRSGTENWG